MQTQAKSILKIELKQLSDFDTDTTQLGYLGTFSSRPLSKLSIDRSALGEREPVSDRYRYFNPDVTRYNGQSKLSEEEILQYCGQDYRRLLAYCRGEWSYIGIQAHAIVTVRGITQTITTAGRWGIEGDSDESYLSEVGKEELFELRQQLYAMGFSKRKVSAAFKTAKVA